MTVARKEPLISLSVEGASFQENVPGSATGNLRGQVRDGLLGGAQGEGTFDVGWRNTQEL